MHKYIFGVTFLVLIGIVFSWSRLSSQPLLETNPEQLNTIALELKAVSSDPVDAAFYRTASKVRYNIDKQVYPPLGKGDSSPGVLFSALSSVFQQGQPQDTLTIPVGSTGCASVTPKRNKSPRPRLPN